jgi:hypothetical protein
LIFLLLLLLDLADKRLLSYCRLESAAGTDGSVCDSLESAIEKLVQDVLTFVSAADIFELAIDTFQSVDKLKSAVDILEPAVETLESSSFILKSAIDMLESAVDTLNSSLDMLESAFDKLKSAVDFSVNSAVAEVVSATGTLDSVVDADDFDRMFVDFLVESILFPIKYFRVLVFAIELPICGVAADLIFERFFVD